MEGKRFLFVSLFNSIVQFICAAIMGLSLVHCNCSKYSSHSIQDGIVLKLNRLNSSRKSSTQMMAVTPSPEDVLDAPDMSYQVSSGVDDSDALKSRNSFCCDAISLSKRTPDRNHRSTRRRRGPGQAVQVIGYEEGGKVIHSQEEVRHRSSMRVHPGNNSHRDSTKSSASNASLNATNATTAAATSTSSAPKLSIITSAPQSLNTGHRTQTPNCTASSTSQTDGKKSQQPFKQNQSPEVVIEGSEEMQASRNYDDMIKFVFTEHGIKVISDKEYVV